MMIFVYGTLLKGMSREPVLERCRYHGPAMIEGELYDLGAYPGVLPGDGNVIGELYEVDDATLHTLDRIEGYEPAHPEASLYLRETVTARRFSDGESVEARSYIYNHPIDPARRIRHGDYRRHLLERESESQWIVAYGSNMSSKRVEKRVGPVSGCITGHLDGYRLVFNKCACTGTATYANIRWCGEPHACPAVAWKLTPAQIADLDCCEGTPHHYLRIGLPFHDSDGKRHIVQAYIAHPDQLTGMEPEPWYVELIHNGYREHGFDPTHLEYTGEATV
ncbi:MAG TPA: gamma-glutamylcyclotransferase [Gammaproteobacteria bacterium]|nr:gamma-glutamylcyclotransferase [Gammaproteobacteria bacterium]